MKPAARLTTTQRDRAIGRVRAITVGTALASTAATGAFGYLAIVTDPGVQVTDETTTAATDDADETNVRGAASTAAPTSGLAAATAAPTAAPTTRTTKRHAISGGS